MTVERLQHEHVSVDIFVPNRTIRYIISLEQKHHRSGLCPTHHYVRGTAPSPSTIKKISNAMKAVLYVTLVGIIQEPITEYTEALPLLTNQLTTLLFYKFIVSD